MLLDVINTLLTTLVQNKSLFQGLSPSSSTPSTKDLWWSIILCFLKFSQLFATYLYLFKVTHLSNVLDKLNSFVKFVVALRKWFDLQAQHTKQNHQHPNLQQQQKQKQKWTKRTTRTESFNSVFQKVCFVCSNKRSQNARHKGNKKVGGEEWIDIRLQMKESDSGCNQACIILLIGYNTIQLYSTDYKSILTPGFFLYDTTNFLKRLSKNSILVL